MRIDLGAKVRTKDGHSAGHIKQAIWDRRRNEVIEFVVSTGGLLSRDAIVSSEMLESAAQDGGEIVLDITNYDLEELARFEPTARRPSTSHRRRVGGAAAGSAGA